MQRVVQPPSSLPVRLTSFVGRSPEIGYLSDLLRRERSVTLVGAPGVGKTSLALQVAAAVQGELADGVWLAELAGLSDPRLTPNAVAAALRLHEEPGRPIERLLAEHLAARELLLVLDNCEHLVDACAQLVEEILRVGPGVRVLATSREALRNDGEVTWRVPSLSVPDLPGAAGPGPERAGRPGQRAAGPSEVAAYEAVQLFVERARSALPSFAVTPVNEPIVAEICRRLDGIPLAIELAAARIGSLGLEEIATRLGDRFALTSSGRRTAIPRQQTLRGAIDWSYDLLPEDERTLLRRLAVFAGDWTVAAAEAVCGAIPDRPGDPATGGQSTPADATTLDLLVRLVERSLVQVEPDRGGEQWYRLLEMIRQYGLERLQAVGEEATIRRRHLHWYADLAARGQEGIHRDDGPAWLERQTAELDNLRAALAWSLEDDDPASAQAGLAMAGALFQFWFFRDHLTEGRHWLERVLTADRQHPMTASAEVNLPPVRVGAFGRHPRVIALNSLCGFYSELADMERARAHGEEALALALAVGDEHGYAHTLVALSAQERAAGRHESAVSLLERACAIFKRLDDPFGRWRAPGNLGTALSQFGETERAQAVLHESLVEARSLGHLWGVANALRNLGHVAQRLGDLDGALALLEESLACWSDLNAPRGMGWTLAQLGSLLLERGEPRKAASYFAESLGYAHAASDRRGAVRCIVGIAAAGLQVAQRAGAHPDAAPDMLTAGVRLLGFAASWHAATGISPNAAEATILERSAGVARARLRTEVLASAWGAGERLPFDRTVELGLGLAREIESVRDGDSADPAPTSITPQAPTQMLASPSLLTPREREIAVLVGRGYTNRRIAQELIIAEKTAEVHARNIREKLGLSTRAQIAA